MRHGIGWMLQIGVRALWATAVRPPWSTGYAAAFSGADYARPARAPEGQRSRLTPSGPSATCRTALVAVVAPRMSHGRLACLPRCLSATPLSAGEPPAQWLVTTDRWGNPAYRLLSLPDSQDPAPTWQVRPLGARLGPSRGTAEAGYATQQHPWGHSSAGRARRSHRRGQEFDPPWLHHYSVRKGARKAGGPAITGLRPFSLCERVRPGTLQLGKQWGHILGHLPHAPRMMPPLSDLAIRRAKPSSKIQKLSDGGSLYLEISPAGGRWWRL